MSSRSWFVTPISWIDAWHYVGFFHHYTDERYSPEAYKLARLPWILAGWLVHRFATGVIASYLLHALFLIASTLGFFVLVRRLFGSTAVALLGAMLLGFFTQFHGSGGWDYHNAAAGAFYLWALAAVTSASMNGGARRAMIAGVLAALAVHANITYANFLPVLAAHYLVIRWGTLGHFEGFGPTARTLTWGTLGAVGITAVLAGVNFGVGREALFFGSLLEITVRYTRDTSHLKSWWHPWREWFWGARHLALGIAMLLLSIPVLVASRHGESARKLAERLVICEFVVMAIIWSAWQSAGNLTVEWDYFFFPLVPHILLAVAALLSAVDVPPRRGILLATPVILGVPLVLGTPHLVGQHMAALANSAPLAVAALVFLFGGLVLWSRRQGAVLAFVMCFALGNAVAAKDTAPYSVLEPCHTAADAYDAIVSVNRFVTQADPRLKDSLLWFPEGERAQLGGGCSLEISQIGYAVAGTGVPYLVQPFPMPPAEALPGDVIRHAGSSHQRIVIVAAAGSNAAERLEHRLRQEPIAVSRSAARWFPVSGGGFQVTVVQLGPDERFGALPGAVLADWTSETLVAQSTSFSYTSPPRAVVERASRGELRFVPATPQDHLATPFVSIPRAEGDRALQVSATPGLPDARHCTMSVQDQDLRPLGDLPCAAAAIAAEKRLVMLPAGVQAIRIYFQSTSLQPMVLPRTLRVVQRNAPRREGGRP